MFLKASFEKIPTKEQFIKKDTINITIVSILKIHIKNSFVKFKFFLV